MGLEMGGFGAAKEEKKTLPFFFSFNPFSSPRGFAVS